MKDATETTAITMKYTYSDSEAGMQRESFNSLPEIIAHIESFPYKGDSDGIVFQDGAAIIEYSSRACGLSWKVAEIEMVK